MSIIERDIQPEIFFPFFLQDEAAASSHACQDEMSAQRQLHDKQIAKLVSDAAQRQAYFETQMASVNQEAVFRQLAFDKLTSEYAKYQRTSALVSTHLILLASCAITSTV